VDLSQTIKVAGSMFSQIFIYMQVIVASVAVFLALRFSKFYFLPFFLLFQLLSFCFSLRLLRILVRSFLPHL